jgi:3-isopropylmalate/(R)-2-methylmalate dehydratase small subunit
VGLPVLICDTDQINDGDELEVNLEEGEVKDLTNGNEIEFTAIPSVMLRILNEGGLVPFIKKYQSFDTE